eukprot:81550-Pleurochrysis_carterae.AAC.3
MAQAGRRWQRSFCPWLREWRFTQCASDPCVFTLTKDVDGISQRLIFGCYVEDLFTLYSQHDGVGSLYHRFTSDLASRWNVENEEPISDLLTVDISADADCVTLWQEKCITHLVETYLPDGVPLSFHKTQAAAADDLPSLVNDALRTKPERTIDDTARQAYQALVGALLYCSIQTRPDVAYAVGLLCRAMSCPTPPLMDAARRVLMYLHHHKAIGLRYQHSPTNDLIGYSDSDWDTRHSTYGFVFTYNQAAISWSSKKQATVALSSCEAETVAASEATKELVYLRALLNDLGFARRTPTSLAMDNKSAIDLPYNPEHHQRSKHIDRSHFFVRERVESFYITVPFVRSSDNLADFLTKPLPPRLFFPMRDHIINVAR